MSFNQRFYREIKQNIANISEKNIKIVAISKNHPLKSVEDAIGFGIRVFGENRVQEATNKFLNFKNIHKDLELHLTGPLQTNKVSKALQIFDVFQTLDREKLAKEFVKFSDIAKSKTFYIQVNIGKESGKSGISPELADDFIKYCTKDLNLNISGLMCIPPIDENPREFFLFLKKIAKKNNLENLSMGMSGDYLEGVKCGATCIRVGTLLFGERVYEN